MNRLVLGSSVSLALLLLTAGNAGGSIPLVAHPSSPPGLAAIYAAACQNFRHEEERIAYAREAIDRRGRHVGWWQKQALLRDQWNLDAREARNLAMVVNALAFRIAAEEEALQGRIRHATKSMAMVRRRLASLTETKPPLPGISTQIHRLIEASDIGGLPVTAIFALQKAQTTALHVESDAARAIEALTVWERYVRADLIPAAEKTQMALKGLRVATVTQAQECRHIADYCTQKSRFHAREQIALWAGTCGGGFLPFAWMARRLS